MENYINNLILYVFYMFFVFITSIDNYSLEVTGNNEELLILILGLSKAWKENKCSFL